MSNLTAAQRRLVTTAARAYTVTDRADLASADAIVALADQGMSSRVIADHLRATGVKFAPAYGTIALVIKVRRSLTDPTAEQYVTALRTLRAERSKRGSNNARANAESAGQSRPASSSTSAPTTDGGTDRVVTADDAIAMLAALVTAAERFDAADRARLAAALHHASSVVAPIVTAVAA